MRYQSSFVIIDVPPTVEPTPDQVELNVAPVDLRIGPHRGVPTTEPYAMSAKDTGRKRLRSNKHENPPTGSGSISITVFRRVFHQ